MNKLVLLFLLMFCLVQLRINAQDDLDEKVRTQIISNTDTLALKSFKEKQKQKSEINKEKINNLIKKNPNLLIRSSKNGKTIELKEIKNGRPVYRTTFNRVAAQTTSTDDVWSSPFNLDGSGINIGLWDGGAVDEFHTSFREGTYGQKHVFYVDPDTIPIDDHATHVAGTIVADDDNFNSKGMASKSIIISRDWNEDVIEMTNAAALLDPNFPNGILLSNHSYATITGWEWGDLRKVGSDAWYWMAGNMDIEDPDFGNYNEASFDYDEIAFNAPYYTIVWAAGNDRGQGPEPNTQHWVWNGQNWVTSTSYHPKDGEVTNGFNCLPPDGVAKNIITVGAIDDIFNGYQNSSDVKQVNTDFSSWGPTKDGRIKPDIVANGDELYSTLPNLTFGNMSGTSMAAPNVTGSIALLLQHYKNTHSGYVPLSSTVKAILIHSADESGDHPGPDYKYGWGLLNTYKAAQLISLDQTNPTTIQEMDLLNGQPRTISNLYNDGTQPIKITLTWNDIPPVNMVGGPILMRDLDVRLIKGGVTYYPYKLNSASPSSAATTGDNNRDNVEQIFLQSPGAGYYTIVVSHKGTISTQKFSLITTGFIEPFVTFYLKQLGNDNQPFGQASYWDNSIWNSVPPAQPITLSLDKHHFLSIQDFKPSTYEKFNKWDDDVPSTEASYRNWDELSLTATTTQVYSKFIPKTAGITIKNSLEGTTLSGGNIKFKDPWLADITEPPYGLRNQGMSAPFREQPSPFTPDLTSSYNGYVYNGIFLDQSGPGSGWQGAYYKVGMPDEQIISVNGQNRKFYPVGWGGSGVTIQSPGAETGIVFNSTNAVAIATLKGQLMSNSTTGISSNSQRKMVRTDNGIYHLVYESMGNVYYTHSLTSNFDGQWAEEQWVDVDAKNPAIAYYGNIVYIVFEKYSPGNPSNTYIKLIDYQPTSSGIYHYISEQFLAQYPVSYFGNAKPIVGAGAYFITVVYRKNSTEGLKEKTKWKIGGNWNWGSENSIPETDANSINPSIAVFPQNFHLVFESLNKINYKQAYIKNTATWWYNPINILSDGSGFTKNNYPNISISNGLQTYLLVSWLGAYNNTQSKIIAKENDYGLKREAVVVKAGYNNSWGGSTNFSNNVNFTNNNSINSSAGSIITWSESNGLYSKFVKRNSNGTYSTIANLSTSGIQTMVSNGSSFDNIKVMVFNTSTAAPYLLNKCTNNFVQGGLSKIGETEIADISYGRAGVVEKNGMEFLFNIGDVSLNGQTIQFIERIDTLPVNSLEELNEFARTESFNLNSQSELIFSNYYYVVNPSLADSVLTDIFNVNFKCELVNSTTNQVIGTFDNITYSKSNVDEYNNSGYLVDCSGIESGDYFLRLFTTVSEDVNLFISDFQRDDIHLEKSNLIKRNFKGEGLPTTYELAQNYPNPFNPSTTIKYQLPKDGIVTLKVYDILGSEVATLVNEQKTAGRYEVSFNASQLASGVYIYRLQSGEYVSSKKMMLLK